MGLSIENPLLGSSGNQLIAWNPALISEPRFDISASWEDILALPPKARGELGEARTAAKLMEMGVVVARPIGDSAKWDLIVEAGGPGGKISRLQVKSAWVKSRNAYTIATSPACDFKTGRRRCYGLKEIDFFVGYVAPEETWFIFPVRLIRTKYVEIKTDPDWRFARFRERWDLLFGRK
jgi:hypothetical protein